MSVTTHYSAVMLLTVLACAAAQAQQGLPEVEPLSGPEVQGAFGPGGQPSAPPAYTTAPGPTTQLPSTTPDDWMLYRRPTSCFCPIGGNGPIQTEVYLRSGPDLPLGGGVYSRIMQTGWEIAGGGRALFFNTANDAAWVVDLGLVNQWNHTNRPDVAITLSEPVTSSLGVASFANTNVTARALNRTLGSASLGKEWWLTGPANPACNGRRIRWGLDVGGRYGSDDATFNEIRHRTDVIGAAFVAVHADLEIPCGCCTFIAGLRTEYDYTWSDILQSQQSGDVGDIVVLMTFGVRF